MLHQLSDLLYNSHLAYIHFAQYSTMFNGHVCMPMESHPGLPIVQNGATELNMFCVV